MMTQKTGGIVLLVAAAGLLLVNISDVVVDLQNWHYATTPQFIGALLKQIGSVIMAALGGSLLPQPKGDA